VRVGVDGLDDPGVVDALQGDGGDAEVAFAELALDDDQRHAFARPFDGVGVPKLVWREAPAHAGFDGLAAEFRTRGGAYPMSAAAGAVDNAEQRPNVGTGHARTLQPAARPDKGVRSSTAPRGCRGAQPGRPMVNAIDGPPPGPGGFRFCVLEAEVLPRVRLR
jgi:hypothetical protein